MGARGPQPLPTAVKERRGTLERSRVSEAEPEWSQVDGEPPASLDGWELTKDSDAVIAWKALVPDLINQGLAPRVSVGELVALCNSWATYLLAGRELAENGYVTTAQSGYESPSAWVAIRKHSLAEYTALCARFGLDPASAGKVTARPKGNDVDELAKVRAERRASR